MPQSKKTVSYQKTHKKKVSKSKRKKDYLKIGHLRIRKNHVIGIIAGLLIIAIIISILPPSQSEIDQRLRDVVDSCIYNENSRACKNLTNKYDIKFEYCHAYSDIPEIGKTAPIYGVASLNSFKASTLNYSTDSATTSEKEFSPTTLGPKVKVGYGTLGEGIFPYYACSESIEKMDQRSYDIAPETIALYGLSRVPQYEQTGDYWKCALHTPAFNNLWDQIPNISIIKNEGRNILKIYNKCSMLSDAQNAVNELNAKIRQYANDFNVQRFYRGYDEWNTRGGGCTWFDKTFTQRCGAGSDGTVDSAGYGSMVKDFASDMEQYLYSKYFTSKIVISN